MPSVDDGQSVEAKACAMKVLSSSTRFKSQKVG